MTVRDCIERLKLSLSSGGVPQNEEMTKLHVIIPLLDELGWDVTNRRGSGAVRYEFSVGSQKSKGRIDIALLDAQGRATCLVEAKAPQKDLADHVDQLLGYAFYEGASVCALTTGTLWWLYLPRERGAFGDRRFAELDLVSDDTDELSRDFLRFLSHKSLDSGRAEREAKAVLSHRQEAARIDEKLPALWQQMVGSKPDPELVELVRRRLLDTEHLQASSDQVAAVIAGSRTLPSDTEWHLDLSGTLAQEQSDWKSVEDIISLPGGRLPKPVAVKVLGRQIAVKSWIAIYRRVIDVLYECDPLRFFDIARQFESDWNLWFIGEDDLIPDGLPTHEIGSTSVRVWLNSGKGKQLVRRASRMLNAFGYSETDLKVALSE